MVLLPFLRMVRVLLILRKSVTRIPTEQIASSLLLLAAGLVSLGALTVWRLEYQAPDATITTIGRAFWWAMVTTTTVGYGDEYPVTAVGTGRRRPRDARRHRPHRHRVRDRRVVVRVAQGRERRGRERRGRAGLRTGAHADVAELHGRLDAMAAEQTRIRELLERLALRESGPA